MNIGIDEISTKTSLIVLDPSNSGSLLCKHLQNDAANESSGKWQTLVKRGLHTISKKHYQIVYVKPGLMTTAERNASKNIMGESFEVGPSC